MSPVTHPQLHAVLSSLRAIHDSLSTFQPLAVRPPILDSSTDAATYTIDSTDDGQWLQQENIPGLKQLRDSVRVDLDGLEKFINGPTAISLPPLSSNAPYLISVYNEVLCAPPPILSVLQTFPLTAHDLPNDRSQHVGARIPSIKVDVVADSGRRWIRVNTIKNSRILAEFREIDSYLTESDSDEDSENMPSLAPTEFDNSVIQMGRSLAAAAKANPIEGPIGPQPPKVVMRLTRLNPFENGESDPRILQTIQCLRDMGIDVGLGERAEGEIPDPARATKPIALSQLVPTENINLDLSVLIAVVSDLTHSPLPMSAEEANLRFVPSQRQREANQRRAGQSEADFTTQTRALTSQVLLEMLQEMGNRCLFQELHDRLLPISSANAPRRIQFWTTSEARDRFTRIVSKIGGPREKQRAEVLFASSVKPESAEIQFWKDSRYGHVYIPLLPVRLYPEDDSASLLPRDSTQVRSQFFRSMEKTCRDILAQETPPDPHSTSPKKEQISYSNNGYRRNVDSERAIVTKANARLTSHTVQSMLWGARLGWTTLTANKTSVKALLREIKAARVAGRLAEDAIGAKEDEIEAEEKAAVWIVDPRSLAECMRSPSLP
ncbi:hypothetical protein B0H10DRAFT_1806835 [Mycena sp. CBHHK59/15]|nr:hypothetical protein B0H10DRAFT_1806835 [Mycena sp. CBHHK59/15]